MKSEINRENPNIDFAVYEFCLEKKSDYLLKTMKHACKNILHVEHVMLSVRTESVRLYPWYRAFWHKEGGRTQWFFPPFAIWMEIVLRPLSVRRTFWGAKRIKFYSFQKRIPNQLFRFRRHQKNGVFFMARLQQSRFFAWTSSTIACAGCAYLLLEISESKRAENSGCFWNQPTA